MPQVSLELGAANSRSPCRPHCLLASCTSRSSHKCPIFRFSDSVVTHKTHRKLCYSYHVLKGIQMNSRMNRIEAESGRSSAPEACPVESESTSSQHPGSLGAPLFSI